MPLILQEVPVSIYITHIQSLYICLRISLDNRCVRAHHSFIYSIFSCIEVGFWGGFGVFCCCLITVFPILFPQFLCWVIYSSTYLQTTFFDTDKCYLDCIIVDGSYLYDMIFSPFSKYIFSPFSKYKLC